MSTVKVLNVKPGYINDMISKHFKDIHAAAKSHNTVLTLAQKGEDILLINSGALTSTLDVSKMEKAKQFVDKIIGNIRANSVIRSGEGMEKALSLLA